MHASPESSVRTSRRVARRGHAVTPLLVLSVALGSAGAISASTPDDESPVPEAGAAAEAALEAVERSVRTFPERVVLPAHEALAAAATRLAAAAAAFDAAPDATTLETLRRERLRTEVFLARGRAFAFGPTHSLGHDAALLSPVDEAGVALTIAGLDGEDVDELVERPLAPSLGGLGTMAHLLGDASDPAAVTPAARRYLHALARRVERTAHALLDVWRDGHDGHPAFAAALTTAGRPDNLAYLSVDGAAEEIARGLIDTLDVVAGEELPDLARQAESLSSASGAASLAVLRAGVGSVEAAYREAEIGRWLGAGGDGSAAAVIERSLGEAGGAIDASVASAGDADAVRAALTRAATSLERVRARLEDEALPAPVASAASAGAATAHVRGSSAFEAAPPNLAAKGIEDHDLGDEAFEETFVLTGGHATSGLGPTFNNTSCVACHVRNGRGMPVPGQLLLRVSDALPGGEDALADESDTLAVRGNTPPVDGLGNQIQDFAVAGGTPEARVDVAWRETPGAYPDGTPYSLRVPRFEIVLASTGERLPEGVRVSPRVPPHVYGLGLLEAVTEDDILALADPDDLDGDGISGRPNRVWNEALGDFSLGRFGWKANSPTLLQQTADAYLNDMGITSPMFPAEDGSSEIDAATLHAATAYSQTLAAPARRAVDDPVVERGEALFAESGCGGCHVDTFTTGPHAYPALAGQRIHPYTDLLLHDMGEGLADDRPDFEASGREWRTPSLWGVGLAQTVLPYSGFLHDGRARTLEEAILWHGGEADAARARFETLPADDRGALIRFLSSL